jgi:tetratricopeptide (TPR) repeat protein
MPVMAFRFAAAGLVLALPAMAGCAARGPSPRLVAEIGIADAHVQAGCYTCLAEALTIYERAGADPRGPATARRAAFETAVLLAVRAKELGVPADRWLQRAQDHANRLPQAEAGLSPAAYIAAATVLVGETAGLDPEMRQKRARPTPMVGGQPVPRPERVALDGAPPTDLLAGYLALALDCDETASRVLTNAAEIFARLGRDPAIRFRVAICGAAPGELALLREEDSRWTDTLLFEARRQLGMRPIADVARAVELFRAARQAFPDSQAIALSLAAAEHALSEFAAALANYESVLGVEPTHRDALLGRVTSLSYLTRYVDAVAAATRLIDLETWHVGDAYYWRAWNRYQLHQLPAAWDDVERATKLLVNTSVYTLAGYIAYARLELDTAIDRFDRAYAMDRTNCEAVWFAGLVHVDQQGWQPAAPKFATAASCFTTAADEARKELDAIAASNHAEPVKARRLGLVQKQLDTAEHRAAQSAFNAAQCFLRLGQKGEAAAHLERAAVHPLLKEKVEILRVALEKLPG